MFCPAWGARLDESPRSGVLLKLARSVAATLTYKRRSLLVLFTALCFPLRALAAAVACAELAPARIAELAAYLEAAPRGFGPDYRDRTIFTSLNALLSP